MEPWFRVVNPREEVRKGRSFNPSEFAIALEQVVAKSAPIDYRDPAQFFDRTCFTVALTSILGTVLRRLDGQTTESAPVLSLNTQFGGGKTHTLTALYHLGMEGKKANGLPGIDHVLNTANLSSVPLAKVAVFVGNAWDPSMGRETPWIDVARQLAGDVGVALLGPKATTVPPGTEALGKVFQAAGTPPLILFDEVLNFLNRHREMADPFYAFIQNLTVAMTGTQAGAAVVSLPRSKVEMTDWDQEWQDKITKVVRRVAKDLIANDEGEVSEVIRKRLFEDLGPERTRRKVSQAYADWCFANRALLPRERMVVDSVQSDSDARESLRQLFEACYPFHPSALSVFQRKWQALKQYQQTRSTLAMLAQWVAIAARKGFENAWKEPLITLGSAPLEVSEFRSAVLGQLGENKLNAAIETDIAGTKSHSRALDVDTTGALKDLHRRVATAILFESSGGQTEKVAHLPDLRFALGGPDLDTASIDNAAVALESKSFFIRKAGTDGFKIHHQATLKKVVNDRRASLDPETDVKPTLRALVQREFEQGAMLPVVPFPKESADVPDSPRLMLALADPEQTWTGKGTSREEITEWTKKRGQGNRLYPGAIVWCVKKPGKDLRDKVEQWLAWKRVHSDYKNKVLGDDVEVANEREILRELSEAEDAAKDEVWASYRYVVLTGGGGGDGLREVDLGAGHAGHGESLSGRVIGALKSEALLNESVGAGYLDRSWPPALLESGAWPLSSLRQCFLDGSLTRLLDPERILRSKIQEFVEKGDFGLASTAKPGGGYERVWFEERVAPEEIAFDAGVFLVKKATAKNLKGTGGEVIVPPTKPALPPKGDVVSVGEQSTTPPGGPVRMRLFGTLPPEAWNRFGTKVIPKLRSAENLTVDVTLEFTTPPGRETEVTLEIQQVLQDLNLIPGMDLVSTDKK